MRKGVLKHISDTLKWLKMESWSCRLSWSQMPSLAVNLRLYSFPSALPKFFFTSLSCRVCPSQWCGPWQAFTRPPLHPCKVKSVLFQARGNRQQWPDFIPFLVRPDLTRLSHNSCNTSQAPWFLPTTLLSHPSTEADFLCFVMLWIRFSTPWESWEACPCHPSHSSTEFLKVSDNWYVLRN